MAKKFSFIAWLYFALLLLGFCALQSANGADFITQKEYGKMLYENPRGISCGSCHGKNGAGSKIANFKRSSKKSAKEQILGAPNITEISLEKFKDALLKGKNIMPRYYLTDEEIAAIYEFVAIKSDIESSNP